MRRAGVIPVAARLAAALLACTVVSVTSIAAPERAELEFDVLRKGRPMGRHSIRVHRAGDELVAEIAIDLEVKFAFVTLFEYRHRNREVWRDGRLVEIETATNNNGERLAVQGRATGTGFAVTGADGIERTLDPGILPTSYWHPGTPDADRLLNTQTGALATVAIERAPASAEAAEGTHYQVSGDLDLNLWYAGGCLTKISFRAPRDGSRIDYRPAGAAAGSCPAMLLETPARTASLTGGAQ